MTWGSVPFQAEQGSVGEITFGSVRSAMAEHSMAEAGQSCTVGYLYQLRTTNDQIAGSEISRWSLDGLK
jgi:hypothetical protein